MEMHRISAVLLIALFGFSLASPAVFASDDDSSLPPCCRRAGKHHCAMQTVRPESSSQPSLTSGPCPMFPVTPNLPANGIVALVGPIPAVLAGFANRPASRPRVESFCRSSYSRAGQKRGPPTPLS